MIIDAVESRRNILSEAYACEHKWKQRLESPVLKQVKFSQFAVQLLEKFDRDGSASVIDMSIFANKLQDMHETEQPMVENILQNFRHSPQAVPVPDAINHAIVKAFIDANRTDLLLQYIKDKNKFGIFPENHAFSILMDFFIKHEDYRGAAQVAYEFMLQEDLSHPVSYLLSLYACIKHLKHPINEPKQEEQTPEEEEDQWIPVNVIRCPYYDDHFDIKDDNFLLGKTLYMLGKEGYLAGQELGRSLQVIGLGLYQKYAKALDLLEKWVSSDMQAVIYDEALERFKSCLENAQTRDADEPEKEMGIRTIDDEIHKLKPTPAQKSECLQRLQLSFFQILEDFLEGGGLTGQSGEYFGKNNGQDSDRRH
ncbi:hypothetical protein ACJMK2_043850 [Sinanodonta woodiana]|uniref:Uncharacterized protein n=1 Tax=Sinanodonta woodiana TaxID=1069815 RepID=A0ABD3VZG9_SINWO